MKYKAPKIKKLKKVPNVKVAPSRMPKTPGIIEGDKKPLKRAPIKFVTKEEKADKRFEAKNLAKDVVELGKKLKKNPKNKALESDYKNLKDYVRPRLSDFWTNHASPEDLKNLKKVKKLKKR